MFKRPHPFISLAVIAALIADPAAAAALSSFASSTRFQPSTQSSAAFNSQALAAVLAAAVFFGALTQDSPHPAVVREAVKISRAESSKRKKTSKTKAEADLNRAAQIHSFNERIKADLYRARKKIETDRGNISALAAWVLMRLEPGLAGLTYAELSHITTLGESTLTPVLKLALANSAVRLADKEYRPAEMSALRMIANGIVRPPRGPASKEKTRLDPDKARRLPFVELGVHGRPRHPFFGPQKSDGQRDAAPRSTQVVGSRPSALRRMSDAQDKAGRQSSAVPVQLSLAAPDSAVASEINILDRLGPSGQSWMQQAQDKPAIAQFLVQGSSQGLPQWVLVSALEMIVKLSITADLLLPAASLIRKKGIQQTLQLCQLIQQARSHQAPYRKKLVLAPAASASLKVPGTPHKVQLFPVTFVSTDPTPLATFPAVEQVMYLLTDVAGRQEKMAHARFTLQGDRLIVTELESSELGDPLFQAHRQNKNHWNKVALLALEDYARENDIVEIVVSPSDYQVRKAQHHYRRSLAPEFAARLYDRGPDDLGYRLDEVMDIMSGSFELPLPLKMAWIKSVRSLETLAADSVENQFAARLQSLSAEPTPEASWSDAPVRSKPALLAAA